MKRQLPTTYFLSGGQNHYTVDRPLKLVLDAVGLAPRYEELLKELGEYVGGEFLEVLDYVDKVASPRLHLWDILGNRFDWVQLAPGHRRALSRLMETGIVYRTFLEDSPWHLHYAMGYLIADPGIFCTLTLTNQTAYGLFKYGDDTLKEKFLKNYLLKDGEKVWYGATFYTEIQGGSDLGANQAVARQTPNGWRINSENKYFASNAGVADGALVTARPEGNPPGAKGLALFFVPALRENGSLNYTIRRLKDKFGTRAVPTAEVEMVDSEAYLLGRMDHGIYEALEILMLARLGNAVGALGIARKAYLEAFAYAQQRQTFGKKLIEHPLIRKDLLEMEAELEGNMLLTFKTVEAFNRCWRELPPYNADFHYARFLAHLTKNMTAEMSARVSQTAMEIFGGIGFMEDFPIARWHREALVTPIWEGSSNIQALDMMETIYKKRAHEQFFSETEKQIGQIPEAAYRKALQSRQNFLIEHIDQILNLSSEDTQYFAKDLLRSLGQLAITVYAFQVAGKLIESERDFRFQKIAQYYLKKYISGEELGLEDIKHTEDIIFIDQPVSERI